MESLSACLCLPTCICTQVAFAGAAVAAVAAVANKFVKLHSQFAVFLLSLFRTAHRESQEQPQTRRHRNMSLGLHSPQLHVVHYSSLPLSLSLTCSIPFSSLLPCLLLCARYAPVCHSGSFYTFHFIVTYAFISQFRSFSLW